MDRIAGCICQRSFICPVYGARVISIYVHANLDVWFSKIPLEFFANVSLLNASKTDYVVVMAPNRSRALL